MGHRQTTPILRSGGSPGIGAILAALIVLFALAASARGQVPVTRALPVPGAAHPADVTVTVTSSTGETVLSVDGMALHGVAWMNAVTPPPYLDLNRQLVRPIPGITRAYPDALWRATVTDSGRDLAELCAPEPDPDGNAFDALNWCLQTGGEIEPFAAATYGILGPLALPTGATLQGAGGAVRQRVVDAWGLARTEAVPADTRTTLRVLDGEAFTFLRPDSAITPAQRVRRVLDQDRTAMFAASGTESFAVRDLELDGNDRSDMATLRWAIAAQDAGRSPHGRDPESNLRNSPSHSGIVVSNHRGVQVPGTRREPGVEVGAHRVWVHGFAATSLLGHYHARFTASTVRACDAAYNGIWYNAEGDGSTWDTLTVCGYSWTHMRILGAGSGESEQEREAGTYTGTTFRNLSVVDIADSPTGRNAPDLMDLRMGYGGVRIDSLYAAVPGNRFLGYARPYTSPPFDPNIRYRPPLDDPAYWAAVGDHTLELTNARVVTSNARLLTLRERRNGPGPITISGLTVVHPDSARFTVATPASYTTRMAVDGLRFVHPDSLAPITEPPTDPDPVDDSEERIRQLEQQVRALEMQVAALTAALAAEQATLATVRDELATTTVLLTDERAARLAAQIARDAALQQLAAAEARATQLERDLDQVSARLAEAADRIQAARDALDPQ